MFYDSLPTQWQTELEKKTGMKIRVEVLFDPDERNILLTGRYDIANISPISYIRDLDIEYGIKTKFEEVTLTFNDPDGYFNPSNIDSPFYNAVSELYENTSAGTTDIKITKKTNQNYKRGHKLYIEGYDYDYTSWTSENFIVSSFEQGASYDTIKYNAGLTYSYEQGTLLYTQNVEGKVVILKLIADNCDQWLSVFSGRLVKFPESKDGQGIMVLSNIKRINYNKSLIGADTDSNKLKVFVDGSLVDSVSWETGSGTVDSSVIRVYDNAILGLWELNFTSSVDYELSSPDGNTLTRSLDRGILSIFTDVDISTGDIFGVCYSGNYVYFSSGMLFSVDVSDHKNPTIADKLSVNPSYDQAIAGNYLIRTEMMDNGLRSYNISDPTNIAASDFVSFGSDVPYSIAISGNYAYVGCYNDFYIVDITDPANMVLKGSIKNRDNFKIGMNVCVSGNYAYMTSPSSGILSVIDISDKDNPSVVKEFSIEYASGVDTDGSYLYVGSYRGKLYIYDMTDPVNLSLVSSIGKSYAPYYMDQIRQLKVSGNYVYCACVLTDSLAIIDVTSKTNPEHVESLVGGDYPFYLDGPYSLAVNGDYVYVSAKGKPGLAIFRMNLPEKIGTDGKNIEIPSYAFSGTIAADDRLILATAINMNNKNIAQALYDLEVNYSDVDNKYIHCSSYFGDKTIGTVYGKHSAGATILKIKVTVPTLIKTGETLQIKGNDWETVTVTSGNTVNTQYPPYIELTVDSMTYDHEGGADVVWEQRGSLDTDFNFDKAYNYFDAKGFNIKLSLDRDMSIEEAIEVVAQHGACYVFQDNWGVSRIHYFNGYSSTIGNLTDSTNIKLPNPEIETLDHVNMISAKYGYDYKQASDGFEYEVKYPETIRENYYYYRAGYIKKKEMYLPGYWDEDTVKLVLEILYKMWNKGLSILKVNTTLQGLMIANSDKLSVSNTIPEIDTDIDIIGKVVTILNGINVQLIGYDCKEIWKE